ncbi:glycoside hydrolase family 6 protein [Streptomyces spinosirectus]|uniref:glycoside hydrolase family 6 protein n=1 Tax=Streptomyces TaxID=1883 RepID=UPI001C9D679F|nr:MULTISPECIES: glycoside hydrolase family 6 protein [Streptomyces]MBY8342144.1 glycoside hydrolase family 6 protein [Streptomyces plumbidurans]UIR22836.1 glycoside hydrolase family 6 protein [Streptomyces spinosirectus]
MVAAASVVVAVGTAAGLISALGDGRGADEARPEVTGSLRLEQLPVVPSPSVNSASPSAGSKRTATLAPSATRPARKPHTAPAATGLYRHPDSQVLDWVRAHPGDPRTAVIKSRIADRPAAVWFADFTPSTIASRVRAVTSGAAAQGRVPVVVAYAIPGRDCGGASEGGAPDLAAYDAWIEKFALGLGSGEVVVILEPDSIAQADCLSESDRGARFASLARAGRTLKAADPRARVYYDAGHSDWNPAARQASLLKQAGAASPASSDGIFSNVSNFHTTADEIAYDRRVLAALGGPADLGAVIDTSRNGNGAPADGEWCDPAGRRIGRPPTLSTGEARIDGYLWVKLPGESDGCKGSPGTFSASYAYDLASP